MVYRTLVISGPKRSGTTLLNRLFDSHPDLVDLNDEAFFWEHAARYDRMGRPELFLDVFKKFDSDSLVEGFIERDLLPWIEGRYRQQAVAKEMEMDLGFDTGKFRQGLASLPDCNSLSEIWDALVAAYAGACARDYSDCADVLIKAADYGLSIIGARGHLAVARHVFILRNPFYALDSLKKSRGIRGQKVLNPFNFAEAVRDYAFFWDNRDEILKEDAILIRYEDLLQSPRETMQNVAAHLGIAFHETLLEPTLQGGDWPGLSSFNETRSIDAGMLDREIKELDRTEIEFIERHLAGLLDAHGYTSREQRPKGAV